MGKRKIATIIIAVTAAVTLCSCSDKSSEKVEKVIDTAVQVAEENTTIPENEFTQLPEEAEADFGIVSAAAKIIFPDVSGKKMYGFKGLESIVTADGEKSCYVFDFYTYKSKIYTKIATIAKDVNSAAIYTFDEVAGEYATADLPESD